MRMVFATMNGVTWSRRWRRYWVLSVIVVRAFELVPTSKESGMTLTELTLGEFDLELRSEGQKRLACALIFKRRP